jgi:hypothetical protein
MPPIPIYVSSPINAAKDGAVSSAASQQTQQPTATSTSNDDASKTSNPPPKPGAAPAPPTSDTRPTASFFAAMPGAATGPAGVTRPTPPQPGATAAMPRRSNTPPSATSAPGHVAPTGMPPQMALPPPTTAYVQRRSTETAFPAGSVSSLAGPRAPQQGPRPTSSVREWPDESGYEGTDDGVWGAAKKWAHNAGDSLAAAESEVWRRINQG